MTSNVPYSALRARGRIDLCEEVPLPAPLTIYVEPTNICNFRCTYCPESLSNYKEIAGGYHSLDLKAFERIGKQILALGRPRTLNFYMLGEPFANRETVEMIALAKQMNLADRVIVTSNASLIDEKMARRLIDARLDYLRVSIYAAEQTRFTQVTGTKLALDRITANIQRLRSLRDAGGSDKPFIQVKMIDSGDKTENQNFLEKIGVLGDESCLDPTMNWNNGEELNFAGKQLAEMLTDPHFRHQKRACPFPFYTLVIHADLRVGVCCVDWAKKIVVGDLSRQTLAEVWHGSPLNELRVNHLRGERNHIDGCRGCTFLHTSPDNLDGLRAEDYLIRLNQAGA